ncbi:MAG: adenylyl-sulfate kinase [Phycisphaerales bacterium]|jgi:adenylyl-sulfate kinase
MTSSSDTPNPLSPPDPKLAPTDVYPHAPILSRAERAVLFPACTGPVRGCTLWLTGLSGSGKSTIAAALEAALLRQRIAAYRLDGDTLRTGLNSGLGFSHADRTENIRRIGEVARLFADAGLIAIASAISPYRADRDAARRAHAETSLAFFEVFVDTPLEVCEARDPKGLYKKARAGNLPGFTGLDSPYEPPARPELTLHAGRDSLDTCVTACIEVLTRSGLCR